ncbi:MAG: hypothetical protein ACJAXL_000600, partial [Alphaproteobacteria bacterium]
MALGLTLSNDVIIGTGASASESEVAAKLLLIELTEADLGVDFTLEEEEEIFEWLIFNTDDNADNDVGAPIITSEDGEEIDLVSVFVEADADAARENEYDQSDRFDENGNPIDLPPTVILPTEDYTEEEKAVDNKIVANRATLTEARLAALSQNPPDLATAR